MYYEIHDGHGAPQYGCEIIRFEEWGEMEEYLDEHPDVMERIDQMDATIVEVVDEDEYADILAEWMNGLAKEGR